jgi:hypothetical protein
MQQRTEHPDNASDQSNHRRAERLSFNHSEVYLFARWQDIGETQPSERYLLRIKDLSTTGLSGLTDMPVSVGDIVFVQLEDMLIPAAQVVWFRRVVVGFAFVQPLPESRMKRLRERHEAGQPWSPAMRLRSDLPNWPDVSEHERGRATPASRS